jgi:hypothetical protein
MSRPKWSVPNHAWAEGERRRWMGRICSGSPVHHHGANTAAATMTNSASVPAMSVGCRLSARRARAARSTRGAPSAGSAAAALLATIGPPFERGFRPRGPILAGRRRDAAESPAL